MIGYKALGNTTHFLPNPLNYLGERNSRFQAARAALTKAMTRFDTPLSLITGV